MAAHKLTATKIDKYKPIKSDEILTDGNGLSIRFRRGQVGTVSRIWMYTYKLGTKSTYLTLGEHGAALSDFDLGMYKLPAATYLTLETARRIATELTNWRRRELNPKDFIQAERARQALEDAARQEAEAAAKSLAVEDDLTVSDLFDAWITDGVRRKDGNAELKRSFNANVLPAIGAIPVRDLTEHHLRGVLRALVDRGVNRTAVMVRNSLTQMFAWGRKRQPWRKLLVEGDPMDLIEIEKIVSPEYDLDNARDRILSAEEIRELRDIFRHMDSDYEALPDKRFGAQPLERKTQLAIWIMLATLCRVGETTMARWEHVDLVAGTWFIPKANVKDNLADLTVYLSPFAVEQFRQLNEISGHTPWCFPSRNTDQHLDTKAISKQLGDRQTQFKKSKDGGPRKQMMNRRADDTLVLAGGANGAWTAHDLRRTGATMMQALGVALDIIDRCQNHVLAGSKVRRHYLHYDYPDEKRAAWAALGGRLYTILSGD